MKRAAQHVTRMRYEMHAEFWLEDKIHIGLVKVITATLGFSYRASFKYYDKGYQQMPLSFVIFLYSHVSSLHVSGFYQPIIGGILSCCLCATTWFM